MTRLHIHILFIVLLALSACSEERRVIEPVVPSGDRVVLLEEFTGKGCTNCPKGSREIDNLLSIYGENLAVISIHAGFFANPMFFDLGQYDLRTTEGEALFEYLGPNLGYPAGVVNRKKFNNELQHTANAWAAFITEELETEPLVEIALNTEYDQTDRQLDLVFGAVSKANINGEIRISIAITESGIIDAQDDFEAGGIVEDYEHKHVLRTMLTKFDGETYSAGLSLGETIEKVYSISLDPTWQEEKIEVIGFISLLDDAVNTFEILQAVRRKIND